MTLTHLRYSSIWLQEVLSLCLVRILFGIKYWYKAPEPGFLGAEIFSSITEKAFGILARQFGRFGRIINFDLDGYYFKGPVSRCRSADSNFERAFIEYKEANTPQEGSTSSQ